MLCCLFVALLVPHQIAFAQETLCDNAIDDDTDGLYDCADPDCSEDCPESIKPLFVNQAVAEMLGYDTPADVTKLDSLLPLICPSDRSRMEKCHRARLSGEQIPAEYELHLRSRNGNAFVVHTLAKTITWDGEPAVQLSLVNIERRKRAERALRDAHQKLSFHLDNSPLAVLERGYSVARLPATGAVLRDAREVAAGDPVELMLHRGSLRLEVRETLDPDHDAPPRSGGREEDGG